MTNLRLLCILIVLAAVCGQGRPEVFEIIRVSNGSPWGPWDHREMCPDGSYAGGFSVRVEEDQGWFDDTALNGIRLHCVKGGKPTNKYVESNPGHFGDWSQVKWCYSGFTRFKLQVEGKQGGGDDTAANNIDFSCSTGGDFEFGAGMDWGDWGGWGSWSPYCSSGKVICGIETKVEVRQAAKDDTALNDVRFYCCDK